MSLDAPDWERILTTVAAAGDVPDAPDWQRIAVAPGGTPITGVSGLSNDFPPDQGYYGWAGPPYEFINGSSALTNSRLDLVFAKSVVTGTANNIYLNIQGAVTGLTANKNFVGLYSPNLVGGVVNTFTLLGSSAAGVVDTIITSQGVRQVPLAAGVPVVAGAIYYIAFVYTQTSGNVPTVDRSLNQILFTGQPYAYRYLTAAGSVSALPPTVTLSGSALTNNQWWAAFGP